MSPMNIPDPQQCWTPDLTCIDQDKWDTFPDRVRSRALLLAQETLSRLTLGRVGVCPVTVRPCAPAAAQGFVPLELLQGGFGIGRQYIPYQGIDGQVRNYVPCGSSCSSACELDLGGVIGRLDNIKVDGVALDLTATGVSAAVADGHILVLRGLDVCPFTLPQDLSKPDTEPGTWSVTYLEGYLLDENGASAYARLAMEFAKACSSGQCDLPTTVVSVVRQSTTYTLSPGLFTNGQTGIRAIDTWIKEWNPRGLTRKPSVWSPDTVEHRVEEPLTAAPVIQ